MFPSDSVESPILPTRTQIRTLGALAVAALAPLPAGAFRGDEDSRSLEFVLEYETVPASFATRPVPTLPGGRALALPPGWSVQADPRTGHVHAAWGAGLRVSGPVADRARAADLARTFLLERTALLGARPGNMTLASVRRARGRYAAHFHQTLLGIPVHRGRAWVLLDDAGRVTAFGSEFFPEPESPSAVPSLSAAEAETRAAAALGAAPLPGAAETALVWVPAPRGELMELALSYRVTFDADRPFGRWESFVDARTGEILARRNLAFPVNVTGTADGDVQSRPPALSYCDGSAVEPLAHLLVSVQGGDSAATDAAGNFDIAHAGSASVTVDAELRGPYIDVNRAAGLGADAGVSQAVTPGTPAVISFDTPAVRRDEMDTFFHGNRIRDFMVSLDTTFTNLDLPVVSNVGRTDGNCPGNAWWVNGTMNYCAPNAGTGHANTGELGNVIYHEYGHGITEKLYGRNGQPDPPGDVHEGNSDVVANFLDRNSDIGRGFFQDDCGPGSGIRNANNSLQWPDDNNGGHFGGQIIAGFHWDAWQSLLAAMPAATADSIAFTAWHLARDMGLPQNQADQVMWNFLVDDDDSDLSNGTPNYDHFCLAATNHGFSCPPVTVGVFIVHTPLGHTTDDVSTHPVTATITSTEAALNPAALELVYSVDGGAPVSVPLAPTGNPDEFSTFIPPQDQHSEVTYYLSAMDVMGNSRTDPALAPYRTHAFDVAHVYDDIEGATAGWSTVDAADTGEWEAADPISTNAVPEDDATPDPGTVAWITGQCSGTPCGGGCTLGCNDIDNGTVQLLTPVYDVTGMDQVKVKYDRFYSNDTGASPREDTWLVEISNDSGATWTTVESTEQPIPAWTTGSVDVDALFGAPAMVQLRFSASDLTNPSLVEAGVDELRVLAEPGAPTPVGQETVPPPGALELAQNRPNPFGPETTIRYALPERAQMALTIHDVTGRTVRRLASGVQAPGRYAVRWDGRDERGSRVGAGIFFYRLSAGNRALHRKLTVLP